MLTPPFMISGGIIAATGAIVSAIGLAGCTIFSIMPDGTISLHPVFAATAVIGIAIVIGSSFVEARAARKRPDSDDLF